MSRITLNTAELVANAMVAKKDNEIKKMKKQIREICLKLAMDEIPIEIKGIWKKRANYMQYASSIYIVGPGFNHHYCDTEDRYPAKDGNRLNIIPEPKIAKQLLELFAKIEKQERQTRELYNDIKNAVYNLRTYSNVEKEFKEAFAFLPKPTQTAAVALNIDSIKSRL